MEVKSLIGKRRGTLVVIEDQGIVKKKRRWKAACDCGGEKGGFTTDQWNKYSEAISCGCKPKVWGCQEIGYKVCRKCGERKTYAYFQKNSHTCRKCYQKNGDEFKGCITCEKSRRLFWFGPDDQEPDGLSQECAPCKDPSQYVCYRCERTKCMSEFKRDARTGNPGYCFDCKNSRRYETQFGITHREYLDLLKSQNYSCGVCKRHRDEFTKEFAVDHDHSCCPGSKSCGSCVRGLLCTKCNTGIGLIREENIFSAHIYVEHHRVMEELKRRDEDSHGIEERKERLYEL